MRRIKKFKTLLLIFALLISFKSLALSPEYEKELYIGCYGNSKQYLVPDRAKIYCSCTIDMLSKKILDQKIDQVFKIEAEEIIKATEFATIKCENYK